MPTELYQRCNYWPNCNIHLGKDRPKQYSQEAIAEMVSMHLAKESIIDIARTFDTSPQTVSRILRRSLDVE